MSERLTIETDHVSVEVLPELGGSLAAFDLKARQEGCRFSAAGRASRKTHEHSR
jgi:hypothetical protein